MRVVILGTGTDVGKTYFTECLARSLAQQTSALALKPVESGVVDGNAGDAGRIALAAGHEARLSPWRFTRPVSPHLAARDEGATLEVAAIARWVDDEERRASRSITLIETAGGAFSPLGHRLTNLDLALGLAPALWLLVAPDSLGVLHDLTATLRAMPRPPDAIVLSCARREDESTASNASELQRLGICEVLERLAKGASEAPATSRWLLERPSSEPRHR